MEGQEITTDFDKAYTYLIKAFDLEEKPANLLALARFHCVSNGKHKDVDKCIEYFRLKQFKDKSEINIDKTYKKWRSEMAKAFIDGQYSAEELTKLQSFLKEEYKLTHINFDLEVNQSGIFEYQESEKFGRAGKYELLSDESAARAAKSKKRIYGLYFNPDLSGIDSRKDKTIIIATWSKVNENGEAEFLNNLFLWGHTLNEWSALRRVTSDQKPATYRLDIFNLNKEKVYTKDYHIY